MVASGGRYLPKFLESRLAECLPGTGITPRERAVLELLAKGFSTTEIARQGNIAEKTVRIHISNVLEKLGAPRSNPSLGPRAQTRHYPFGFLSALTCNSNEA